MTSEYIYEGAELDVFAKAANWKSYWASKLQKYLGPRVLEIGAGIGSTAQQLCTPERSVWVAVEPDAILAERMNASIVSGRIAGPCQVVIGTLEHVHRALRFDSILYIDVLEHIEQDREELENAAQFLDPDGCIVVLAPAHKALFSPFDQAVGHYRRYDKSMMRQLQPAGLELSETFYLDSIGLFASFGNKLFLNASMPTEAQIKMWDSFMIPISRVMDPVLGHRLGKTVVGIWRPEQGVYSAA